MLGMTVCLEEVEKTTGQAIGHPAQIYYSVLGIEHSLEPEFGRLGVLVWGEKVLRCHRRRDCIKFPAKT